MSENREDLLRNLVHNDGHYGTTTTVSENYLPNELESHSDRRAELLNDHAIDLDAGKVTDSRFSDFDSRHKDIERQEERMDRFDVEDQKALQKDIVEQKRDLTRDLKDYKRDFHDQFRANADARKTLEREFREHKRDLRNSITDETKALQDAISNARGTEEKIVNWVAADGATEIRSGISIEEANRELHDLRLRGTDAMSKLDRHYDKLVQQHVKVEESMARVAEDLHERTGFNLMDGLKKSEKASLETAADAGKAVAEGAKGVKPKFGAIRTILMGAALVLGAHGLMKAFSSESTGSEKTVGFVETGVATAAAVGTYQHYAKQAATALAHAR